MPDVRRILRNVFEMSCLPVGPGLRALSHCKREWTVIREDRKVATFQVVPEMSNAEVDCQQLTVERAVPLLRRSKLLAEVCQRLPGSTSLGAVAAVPLPRPRRTRPRPSRSPRLAEGAGASSSLLGPALASANALSMSSVQCSGAFFFVEASYKGLMISAALGMKRL